MKYQLYYKSNILVDKKVILDFKKYCSEKGWIIDKYTSEFTLQFRLGRFLEDYHKDIEIEFESNIERYGLSNLPKKEIDIDYKLLKKRKVIELKYVRDKGSYNIGMMEYARDISFLEELVSSSIVSDGYSILFTSIQELYTPPNRRQNPKNSVNLDLYNKFRIEKCLKGDLQLRTGNYHKSVSLKGVYNLKWIEFDDEIKVSIIKVSGNSSK